MRQTSRAVALLLTLESAQAVDDVSISVQTNYIDLASQFNTAIPTSNIEYNRMAQYTTANMKSTNTWGTPVAMIACAKSTPSTTLVSTVGGSKCMKCIGGGGVWCSRTYAYSSTQTALQGQKASTGLQNAANVYGVAAYPNGKLASITATSVSDPNMIGGLGLDGGSCCAATQPVFNTAVGITAIGAASSSFVTTAVNGNAVSSSTTGPAFVAEACVPFKPANVSSATPSTAAPVGWSIVNSATLTYSSWWCSNGLYRYTTATTAAVINIAQPLLGSSNKRLELAFVGCPQVKAFCGGADVLQTINAITGASATKVVTVAAGGGLTNEDKCTWVATSTLAAPTFVLSQTTYGLATLNWQLHSMEYAGTTTDVASSDGKLAANIQTNGYNKARDALNLLNKVPMFNMPQAQYSMLRTWYGQGGATTASTFVDWFSPYQNSVTRAQSLAISKVATQQLGNVANFPASTANSGLTPGAGNYGSVTVSAATVNYDARAVRYFPAQVAQASWTAGNALYGSAGTYAAAITTYTTAKTNWDAYVAILKKNAKADAFAAAFSPPKAPTVPPLPAQPWVPGAYAGYIKLSPEAYMVMTANVLAKTAALQPTNQQFWTDYPSASSNGGWGTFTAAIITYRNGFGKSFGTIGYSGDANNTAMSSVWNYKWTCLVAGGTSSTICDQTYTVTTANAAPTTKANTIANIVPLYVAVSLWSLGNSGSGGGSVADDYASFAGKNDLIITFAGKAWLETLPGYTALTVTAQPAAASSLTGIAGAQALAASAAAALAAAAALY